MEAGGQGRLQRRVAVGTPITNWEAHLRGFRSGPPEIGRRLVATGDRVYVALDYGEPVTVLDAATGEGTLNGCRHRTALVNCC